MKKEELIKRYCRFYKGEDEFKGDSDNFFYWEAEQIFVTSYGTQEAEEALRFYKEFGLETTTDKIPLGLAAALFKVYSHVYSDEYPEALALSFGRNFLSNYLAQPQ